MVRPNETPLFDTAITRLFGIRHPILCGGLMWLSTAPYVAAVARAGGIGFITARSFPDPGAFREELQTCRELAGGHPFGVNLYLSHRDSDNGWLDGHIDVLLGEGVRAVETAGNSPRAVLPRLKEAGCKVLHKVSILRHAERAAQDGADAIAIVGMECGGHPGLDFIGSMVQGTLAPQRLDVPVVLGGGIGTGRQVVAALSMGAAGVMLGTRMLVSEEIWAHDDYKRRIVEADERSSRLVLAILRNTYRVMDNAAARTVAGIEATGETDFEVYRPYVQGQAQKRVYATGNIDEGMLAMGQAAVFADRIAPVSEIYDDLLEDAAAALEALGRVARVAGPAVDIA